MRNDHIDYEARFLRRPTAEDEPGSGGIVRFADLRRRIRVHQLGISSPIARHITT
jgi:hypothetical protein